MKFRVYAFVVLFSVFSVCFLHAADNGIFTVAGIQFEISADTYASRDAFFTAVEEAVGRALEAEYKPDLIVFPEYIGVFYQLIEFNEIVDGHSSFQDALVDVLAENPQFSGMPDVFLQPGAWNSYLAGWSEIAADYGVSIVAGSCFITDNGTDLYNRSFVYGSDGTLLYEQDKVFLTEFEQVILGLSAGSLDAAELFEIEGHDVALTICKDAYSPMWEQKHSGAFIWIDIKANGETFNDEQRRSFMRALPLRLVRSDVPFGMTVCAVGSYLDLFWEGQSSALYKSEGSLALADISESWDSADSISISISTEQ